MVQNSVSMLFFFCFSSSLVYPDMTAKFALFCDHSIYLARAFLRLSSFPFIFVIKRQPLLCTEVKSELFALAFYFEVIIISGFLRSLGPAVG